MKNNVEKIIADEIKRSSKATSDLVAKKAGITRQAAHKHLSALVDKKKLTKIGKTRKAYYIAYSLEREKNIKTHAAPVHFRLINKNIQEDLVFDKLDLSSDTVKRLPKSTKSILRYAFTEMLNNSIEHSKSKHIVINIFEEGKFICFEVIDQGIGIYNNIREKYRLADNYDAVQELLKGKRTTAPKKHSGEGIFFTSKIADKYEIESAKIRLIIDNLSKDIDVVDVNMRKGTRVYFAINKGTKKDLKKIFDEYTSENYEFSKTKVTIKLYERNVEYVSRSQARRLLYGLEKFKTVLLDFKGIKGIGQSFADEIFRVFAVEHPQISLVPINAGKAVLFMAERAKRTL